MTENRKKILEMLVEKKISSDEADQLLDALDSNEINIQGPINLKVIVI